MAKTYTAIELGAHSVKMAVCDGSRVSKIIIEQMPEGLIVDNRITSHDALADFLKDVIRANGGAPKEAVMVLSGAQAITRRVKFPMMTVDEVKLNLPYEFRDFIAEGKERFVYDYAVLGRGGSFEPDQAAAPAADAATGGSFGARTSAVAEAEAPDVPPIAAPTGVDDARGTGSLELLATAVRKETLEDFTSCCRRAGLRLVSAMPATAALQNLMFANQFDGVRDESHCIINFGAATTELYFFTGGKFDVLRTIDQGGRDINRALAEDLGNEEHLAEQVKMSDPSAVARSQRALDVCESIAVECGRAINFYGFNNQNSQMKALYFTGGESLTDALIQAVTDRTDVPVVDISELYPPVDSAYVAAARLCPAAVGATLTLD